MPKNPLRRSVFEQLPATTPREWFEPFERGHEALARCRRTLERSDAALMILGGAGADLDEILECNAAFVELMGTPRDDLIGSSWRAYTPPEDRGSDSQTLNALLADGHEIAVREKRYLRPGAGEFWASVSVAPLRDAQGRAVAALGLIADISARKSHEAEIAATAAYADERATLLDAISRDRLELVFQPIFELETGRIVAVDTVGARDPERPEVAAHWLLHRAEDLRLGVEFASWVLTRACQERSAWIRERAESDGPSVVVPIPEQMLDAPDLEGRIRACVAQTQTSLAGVAIEIDERVLTDAAPQVEAALRALGEDGLCVYIGGFGEGVTSIPRLRSIPVDGLKGASAFVQGLPEPDALRILSALVALCRAADMTIVAEGIVDADHLHALQDIGCPHGMGPLLAGPMTAEAVADLRSQPFAPLALSRGGPAELLHEPTSDLGPTLPIGTAATALRVSPSTLRRLADDGSIRSIRTAGGHRRFPVSEVRRLGRATLRTRPLLRLQPAIETPRPELAELLVAHGHGLARRAPRSMYAGEPGWYARPEARGPVDDWVIGVTEAVRWGDQTLLTTTCAELSDRAGGGGALLIETLTFLAVFFGSVEYAIGRAGTAPEAALDVKRISGAARQAVLLHVDGHD